MSRRVHRAVLGVASLCAIAGLPSVAIAGPPHIAGAACLERIPARDRVSAWAAPLDRIVSVRLAELPLGDVLDRVAESAGLELSYSRDFLPADKRVCVSIERVAVGALLEALLEGTPLRPVVIGTSQIVLAPLRGAASVASAPSARTSDAPAPASARRASVLDRVVVTGTPDGVAQRGTPFALDVVDGATLSRTNSRSLGEALELAVPGIWAWGATAGTVTPRFGSIRGASSFGVTTPKVYLDGIEVANPLLVTQLDPQRVERVEIIRGPQGAALYGADAISGVVNVLTRHDGSIAEGYTLQTLASAGVASTDYAARDAIVQDHAVTLRAGAGPRTFGLGLRLGTVGAVVPGASERRLLADGDVRLMFDRAILTGTARVSMQQADAGDGLLYGGAVPLTRSVARLDRRTDSTGTRPIGRRNTSRRNPPPAEDTVRFAGDSAVGQDVTQYTVGATLTAMPSLRWTHTLITGVDGYRLQGLSTGGLPIVDVSSAPATARGAADRASFRARAVGRFDVAEHTALSLTFGLEQAITRAVSSAAAPLIGARTVAEAAQYGGFSPGLQGGVHALFADNTIWTNNTGILAQGNLSWRDALFVAVGGRVERNTGATPNAQVAYLPMLGVSFVQDLRGAVVKWRGAYGTGIRPAHSLARGSTWMGQTAALRPSALQPESQTGVEGGVDVLLGRAFTLHVTRFDQRASGLIQPVASGTMTTQGGRSVRLVRYALENIGAIDNRGWEVQGRTTWARLGLGASYSLVDSRVARVAPGYGGELRPGDRMLDVPARTLSASASYTAPRWSASTTLSRASDWISYDRIALGEALAAADTAMIDGAALREYWVRYGSFTRLRATAAARISDRVAVELGADNLLDVQRGAPDNATVLPGRTFSIGIRTSF